MIRLIGILAGSALAITAIFFAFGVPELTGSNAPVEMTVAAPLTPTALPDDQPEREKDVVAPPPARMDSVTAPDAVAAIDLAAGDAKPAEPDAPVDSFEETGLTSVPEPAAAAQSPSQQWYAFWSPFRSELAADGFITQLQRTTGLDYRVVKLKPGVYEVAFAYTDPIDRQDKLERIAAATGLDMSGG